jgi:hypothetical protein
MGSLDGERQITEGVYRLKLGQDSALARYNSTSTTMLISMLAESHEAPAIVRALSGRLLERGNM